jgi:prepilin signal peptidase PulO-like enzyme (type II secretory pathway)
MIDMDLKLFYSIIVFFFGAAIGSFLSAWAFRMAKSQPIWRGRSYCPSCKHTLICIDLVPIFSFLFLRGKCRKCRSKIQTADFLMEIITGGIFLFAFLFHWGTGASVAQDIVFILRDWLFLSGLIFIFLYDYKNQIIPDIVSLPLIVILFGLNLYLGMPVADLLLGVAIGGGFFAAQYVVSRGRWIGDGDIRMGALLGAALGWKSALTAIFIAYFLGAGAGLYLVAKDRKNMQGLIAFGTFLAVGGFVGLYWGAKIFYKLFGIV